MMKRLIGAAMALVLSGFMVPLAGAAAQAPSPESVPGKSGSSVEFVQLDTLTDGPQVRAQGASLAAGENNQNLGNDLSVPAGPEVVGQSRPVAKSGGMPQAPQAAPKGDVSKINPNSPRAVVASPIQSVPGVVSFLLIMGLCVGAGLGAAWAISLITGKKIDLVFSR